MPRAHDPSAELSGAMLEFLSVGTRLDEDDPGLEAFILDGAVHRYLAHPTTWPDNRRDIERVRELYEAHSEQIEEAAALATGGRYVSYAQAILAGAEKVARGEHVEIVWRPVTSGRGRANRERAEE